MVPVVSGSWLVFYATFLAELWEFETHKSSFKELALGDQPLTLKEGRGDDFTNFF